MCRKTIEEIIKILNSDLNGLTQEEAEKRLKKYGSNEIYKEKKSSIIKLIFDSFNSPLIIILFIAILVQLILGKIFDSCIIFFVLILNSFLEVFQNKKAESSLKSLKKLNVPFSKVIRDGKKKLINSLELTVGDIVLLEAGDIVPADGRIIEANSLIINESILTGESEPTEKISATLDKEVPILDMKNMLFLGTTVLKGRGKFVITKIGQETEIGKISKVLNEIEEKKTNLEKNLLVFSKKLGFYIILISSLIFLVQSLKIIFLDKTNFLNSILEVFIFAVALAVAAIPEALSSIISIVLTFGANQMAKSKIIIKKLSVVEMLGNINIILTDKTGTLTQNKMKVTDIFLGEGKKNFNNSSQSINFLLALSLNNDAYIDKNKEIGDSTEIAILKYIAEKRDLKEIENIKKYERIFEIPFDSVKKTMSTFHKINGKNIMFIKGAPDVIFNKSKYFYSDNDIFEIEKHKNLFFKYQEKNNEFSMNAYRVLAFGMKECIEKDLKYEKEENFIFLGLIAMSDPIRDDVFSAIKKAKEAKIDVVMITGDSILTANSIAKKLNILGENDISLEGEELDGMDDETFFEKIEKIKVYARMSPNHKYRIVKMWQKKNKIVAMTGDGVNDALALKEANVGISMGSGTEVAKDASKMTILGDDFSSIVRAIEIGKNSFFNIKKSINYLLSGNLAAINTIIFSIVFNYPNPFTALQLLFINLLNDSLPAISLGFEKSEKNIINSSITSEILDKESLKIIIFRGTLISIFVIMSYLIGLKTSVNLGMAMAFSVLIFSRLFLVFTFRSNRQTSLELGFFQNKYIFMSLLICFSMYFVIFLPKFRTLFNIPNEFGILNFSFCLFCSIIIVLIIEFCKILNKTKNIN